MVKFVRLPWNLRRGRQRSTGSEIRISWRSARHAQIFTETYDDPERARNALRSLERCPTSIVISVQRTSHDDHQADVPVAAASSSNSAAA
jgi:hypothetical protein